MPCETNLSNCPLDDRMDKQSIKAVRVNIDQRNTKRPFLDFLFVWALIELHASVLLWLQTIGAKDKREDATAWIDLLMEPIGECAVSLVDQFKKTGILLTISNLIYQNCPGQHVL